MQPVDSPKLNSSINVTPLVDVVLVLLIIFMVIAPQLHNDAQVDLPQTERPPQKAENNRQIVISIVADGSLMVNETPVTRADLIRQLTLSAASIADPQIVIKGDASLSFGHVQKTMFELEAAGFGNVGLITRQYEG